MKFLILLLACSVVASAGANCAMKCSNHLFGANSPIFNLPLYYSDQHFEYDTVRHCEPIKDDCTTKRHIIQSKRRVHNQPEVVACQKRTNRY